MTYTTEIFEAAVGLLGGEAPENMTDALTRMCEAAEAELTSRLRSGITAAELGELFVSAAGVLALSMYLQTSVTKDTASVRVGSLSVEQGDPASTRVSAAMLRRQAETMLAQYLADRGFGFLGVRG